MRIHTNMHDLQQNDTFDIHLYNGITKLWTEPDPKTADIVAIPLVDRNYLAHQRFRIKAFSPGNLLPANIQLQVGHDILVMGYPLGEYYDELHNLPVVRNGIIASDIQCHIEEIHIS
jgi:hypothetical protein